jgi:hypothetical protein
MLEDIETNIQSCSMELNPKKDKYSGELFGAK